VEGENGGDRLMLSPPDAEEGRERVKSYEDEYCHI